MAQESSPYPGAHRLLTIIYQKFGLRNREVILRNCGGEGSEAYNSEVEITRQWLRCKGDGTLVFTIEEVSSHPDMVGAPYAWYGYQKPRNDPHQKYLVSHLGNKSDGNVGSSGRSMLFTAAAEPKSVHRLVLLYCAKPA